MQNESQNVEYKESWRDEYLKWICGFANAQGGRIYIGVNDQKDVIGLSDAKRLLEDIPNKIVNYLGIVEDVNLLMEGDKEYIEIVVSPSNMPIDPEDFKLDRGMAKIYVAGSYDEKQDKYGFAYDVRMADQSISGSGIEPMPPKTAATKALSPGMAPMVGLT